MQTKTQPEDLHNYLMDASNMPGGYADKLFVPESAEDISKILREANELKIPVTISGARTGTVGGAIPFSGYVISLEKLNRIVEIDKEFEYAIVEPGVVLADLQKAVDADGLFYPPDPTEWSCQVGGTVATNASGARSFKYGSTRDFVTALTVLLADGEKLELRRGEFGSEHGEPIVLKTSSGRKISIKTPTYQRPPVRKNVSGFFNSRPLDAVDLFVGSEGTLGVITEIELKLLPSPRGFLSGVVFFNEHEDLLNCVADIRARSFASRSRFKDMFAPQRGFTGKPKIAPCIIEFDDDGRNDFLFDASLVEYFDDRALRFIAEKFPETPDNMAGAIFFEQETTDKSEEGLFESWNAVLETHRANLESSWFTTTELDREKMRSFRHALPVTVNERVVRNKQKKIGTDMAVPDDRFPGFLKYQKAMLDASGIEYVIFGHIGDCHLHANLLPKNDEEAERSRHIYGRLIAQAIMLGGCVSAEHGIGKLKRKYLNAMMGERYLNEMIEIKRALDPNFILGRGNMFEAEI